MWHRFLPKALVQPVGWAFYVMSMCAWARAAGGSLGPWRMLATAAGSAGTYAFDHLNEQTTYSGSRTYEIGVLAASIMITFVCCIQEPTLPFNYIIFSAMALCYDTPVLMGFRVKALFPFSKTIFVPFMHVMWCVVMSDAYVWTQSNLFMFIHYAILNVALDIKDIADDRKRGVTTVPNTVGADATLRGLLATCIVVSFVASLQANAVLAITFACSAAHIGMFILGVDTPPSNILYYHFVWHILAVHIAGDAVYS